MNQDVSNIAFQLPKLTLSEEEFRKIQKIVHEYSGIYMPDSKVSLVQNRLMKRIRALGLKSFAEYFSFLSKDNSGQEFLSLIDVITTNKTSFFRESKHFSFLRNEVIPQLKGRTAKWWSAGCSSGQEPVTCAITLLEAMGSMAPKTVKILATDLSRDVLRVAKNGIYTEDNLKDIPPKFQSRYFRKAGPNQMQVKNQVKDMITYGRLNLTGKWPLKSKFQVIMCRNVMIYFDRHTQKQIIDHFNAFLEPGGYLFLGHSESISKENTGFQNIVPAVYQKVK